MYRNFFFFTFLIFSINVNVLSEARLGKRRPFSIPLPHLICSFDSAPNGVEVLVTYEGSNERWDITPGNDRYIKDTKKIRMDHIYRELPSQAAFISVFEAGVLAEVCNRMAQTLLILEKDLRYERWDRCLFLDSYFPNFLKKFYHLYSAALGGTAAFPAVCQINDTLFESSENSLKSDKRVNAWSSDSRKVLKLRIASKELAYQLKMWRSNVLLNTERDSWDNETGDLVSVYELFVRLYFNLPPRK